MIFRIYLILAAVIVALFLYLSSLNKEVVFIRFSASEAAEFPIILLLLVSFVSGFLLSLLVSLLKSLRAFLENLRLSKERKAIENAGLLLARAKRAMLIGNPERGAELLKKAIATSSHSPEPYTMLIDHYIEGGNRDEASKLVENIPSSFEDDPDILMAKSRVLLAKEDFERAADILIRLKEREKSTDIMRLLRDTYMKSGKWESAAKIQEEIRKNSKKEKGKSDEAISARIGYEIAKNMAEEGDDGGAVKKLKELIKRSPNHAPLHVLLGNIQWKSGNRDLAEETWKRGFDLTNNMIFLFLLEDISLKEEDPQRIIDAYKGLIIDTPDNPVLHLFLGKLYLRLEMIDDAIESLNRAKEIDATPPYLYRLTGEALFRKGEFRGSAENFKDALGFKRKILIPFVCASCGSRSFDWKGTCPCCGEWDSLEVAVKTGVDETE